MYLQVLLVLLSLAAISRCNEVCVCCKNQVYWQNLTDCSDVARPATDAETIYLLEYCLTPNMTIDPDPFGFGSRIASLTPSKFKNLPSPEYCYELFNNLDGLLYVAPEGDSELFSTLKMLGYCYAAMENGTPGFLCYPEIYSGKTINTFKAFHCCYIPKENVTRQVFFIRPPSSIKIMEAGSLESTKTTFNESPNNLLILGEFSVCNPTSSDMDFKVTFNETVATRIEFKDYSFRHFDSPLEGRIKIEPININGEKFNILNVQTHNNVVQYDAKIEHKLTSDFSIPPNMCATAEVKGYPRWSSTNTKTVIELNFAFDRRSKGRKMLERQATIEMTSFDVLQLQNIRLTGYHDTIIIISYNMAFLLLGCVIGMGIFALLLLIVIKLMNCLENHENQNEEDRQRISETTERLMITLSDIIQQKAQILGDRLVRVGDYISNVTSWAYLELK